MATLPTPTPEQVRDQYLDDVYLAAVDAGVDDPPIAEGADLYVRASALAGVASLILARIAAVDSDWDPRFCSEDRLEQWRITLGLPEVEATGASGKVIVLLDAASGSITDGTQLTYSGRRYEVVGAWTGVTNRTPVTVQAIDVGELTNAPAGTQLTWASAPPGFKSYVEVSAAEPLTGGVDEETAERLRERVVARLSNPAAPANWVTLKEKVEQSMPTTRAYVYPALGGPSSAKVCLTKQIDVNLRDFSREATSGQLTRARQVIWTEVADGTKYVVQSAADQNVNVTLEVEIPDSVEAGGDGTGWIDATPWPQLEVADAGVVSVSGITSATVFTVSANTATPPVDGLTHIVWWSPGGQRFHDALVLSHAGAAGAWLLTVNAPLVDDDAVPIAAGDYIGPAAVSSAAYGETWRTIMAKLGPGENTTDSSRLPMAARHPLVSNADNPTLGLAQRKEFIQAHSEVLGAEYGYRSATTASVPSGVDDAPNVLRLNHFGIYQST